MESTPSSPTPMASDLAITSSLFKVKEKTQTLTGLKINCHDTARGTKLVVNAGKNIKQIQCSQDLTLPVLLKLASHKPVDACMLSLCAQCSPQPCMVTFLSSWSANSCQTVTSSLLSGRVLSKNPLK